MVLNCLFGILVLIGASSITISWFLCRIAHELIDINETLKKEK